MDSKQHIEIEKILSEQNITLSNGLFFKDESEMPSVAIGFILKSKSKYKQYSDSKISELISEYINFVPPESKEVEDDNGGFKYTLSGIAQIPLEMDKVIMNPIKYAKDTNGTILYYVKSEVNGFIQYTPLLSINGKIDPCEFAKMPNYQTFFEWFEDALLEAENDIKTAFYSIDGDTGKKNQAVIEFIQKNIPMTIQKSCVIKWNASAKSIKNITISNNKNSHPTFADFVGMYISDFGSLYLEEIKIPKIYSNNGDAFNTFDISPYIDQPKPELSVYWKEFFSKFTEDETKIHLAWIWGVLDAKNKSRQALVIMDLNGYSAKSVFQDVMVKILGSNLVSSINKDSLSNQFAFSKNWNKRLMIAGDSKNSKIFRTEKMHQILGQDFVDVEYKGRDSFLSKLNSKVLINTNTPIDIDPKLLHERSRVIILNVNIKESVLQSLSAKDENGKAKKDQYGNYKLVGDPNFADNLYNTKDSLLINAYYAYKELCPTNADFDVPQSVLETVYDCEPVTTTSMDSILNHIITITNDESDIIAQSELFNIYKSFCLDRPEYKEYQSNNEYQNFLDFLKKNHNITTKQKTISGKKNRYWIGIKKKGFEVQIVERKIPLDNHRININTDEIDPMFGEA